MTMQNHTPLAKPIFLYDDSLSILRFQDVPLGLKYKELSLCLISSLDQQSALNELAKLGYTSANYKGSIFLAIKIRFVESTFYLIYTP